MLGQESAPPEEEAALRQVEQTIRQGLEQTYPPGVRPARRDAHPKAHGCVRAEFIVSESLPEELRHGIFQEARTYPAWIRFSASSGTVGSDTRRDAHGMAVKVVGVAGEKVLEDERDAPTQDFVMVNGKAFIVRNAADYVLFASAQVKGRPLAFFFGWNPLKWRLHELGNLLKLVLPTVSSPLQIQYWSQTPYRLGPNAIKFSAKPSSPRVDPKPSSPGPDYLREAMVRQLAAGEVSFDFLVQLQTDPVTMPVEDPTIAWDERRSPYRKVATIRIPSQSFDAPARREFGENLSFTPWHTLPDHRPLGGINRCRRSVYQSISRLRHEMNGAPRVEPTGDEMV